MPSCLPFWPPRARSSSRRSPPIPDCGGRLRRVVLPGADEEVIIHAEREAAILADPAAHIAEWLRREAAVPPSKIAALFGIAPSELDRILGELAEDGSVVVDLLVGAEAPAGAEAESGLAVIDAQNLEILLRRSRAAARPLVSARPPEELAKLVFGVQGSLPSAPTTTGREDGRAGARGLERALEALEGVAAPATLWEAELLPARVARYRTADLDAALAASPWQWFGSGKGRVSLARAEDLELFLPARRGGSGSKLVPEGGSSFDFWEIRERAGGSAAAVARSLWAEAWKGLVASDSFRDVREGIANDFGAALPDSSAGSEAGAPARRRRFAGTPALRRAEEGAARFAREVEGRRAGGGPVVQARPLRRSRGGGAGRPGRGGARRRSGRILAARYGLLCRSMLEREEELSRWGDLFPAMRRLELAGELLAGRFFEGVEGPQFLDTAAFKAFAGLGRRPPPAPTGRRSGSMPSIPPRRPCTQRRSARPSCRPGSPPTGSASTRGRSSPLRRALSATSPSASRRRILAFRRYSNCSRRSGIARRGPSAASSSMWSTARRPRAPPTHRRCARRASRPIAGAWCSGERQPVLLTPARSAMLRRMMKPRTELLRVDVQPGERYATKSARWT